MTALSASAPIRLVVPSCDSGTGTTGQGLIDFSAEGTQISATHTYPGAIKPFHYHLRQTDGWAACAGMLQIARIELREDPRTVGLRSTCYIGTLPPWMIRIPQGAAHGCNVIGAEPAALTNVTTRGYDPSDDDPIRDDVDRLNYDCALQHK